MTCRSGCRTKNHSSWGECARAARLQTAPIQNVMEAKAWDREITEYKAARQQGIQPAGTTLKQTRDAVEISQRTGKAFQADNVLGSLS